MSSNGHNGHNGRYTAQQFIDAIPGTGGIVTTIARRVGCNWHTARRYIDVYPTVKRAYDDEVQTTLDAAESVILGEIQNKEVQTAKWYLTMKGRERGYATTERHEHSGKDGATLKVEFINDWRGAQGAD